MSIEINNLDPLELAIADLIAGVKDHDSQKWICPSEPFYGRLLASLPRSYCTEDKSSPYYVPTAAVCLKNNSVSLLVNKEFFSSLGRIARRAIIKHEAQHIAHRHLFRAKNTDYDNPQLQNIAMDAVINQFNEDIAELEKPNKDGETFDPVSWQKIEGAVADQSWKGYYELLEKDQEQSQDPNGGGDGEGGDGEGDGLAKYGDVIDDHSHFGKVMDESNPEIAEQKLKDTIQKTARGLKPGDVPVEVQKILDDIVNESKVPWRVLLRNWMKTSRNAIRKNDMLRESMSVAGVFPGFKRTPKPEFHVYADMSGSVSDTQATAFFSEIMAIQKSMKAVIHLHQFDTKIHSSEVIDRAMPVIQRDAWGGTNFQCCVDHMKENKVKNAIFMTDGYAPSVDLTGLNVLWAFTEYHQSHGGKEVVITD